MKKNKHYYYFIALAVLSGSTVLFAAPSDNAGTGAAVFMRDGQGARALSMGGAYTAVGRGISSVYWNPGGIAKSDSRKMSALLNYNTMIEEMSMQSASYLYRSKESNWALGVGGLLVDMGTVEARDASGTLLGDQDIGASSYQISYGYGSEKIGFGVNLKSVEEDLSIEKGSAFVGDLGVLGEYEDFSFGVSLQNFGTKYDVGGFKSDMAYTIRAGAAYVPKRAKQESWERVVAALDVELPSDDDLKIRTGMELVVNKLLDIRVGYEHATNSDSVGGLSFGFGFWTDFFFEDLNIQEADEDPRELRRISEEKYILEFDYAFLMRDSFDDLHRVTISFHF